MDAILSSRPETYWQLLKRSFIFYRVAFIRVLPLAFLLAVITFIPRLLSVAIGQDIFSAMPPFSPQWLWLLFNNIISLMLFIAVLWRMHCIIRSVHEKIAEDFYIGGRKVLLAFVATVIQSAMIAAIGITLYGIQFLLFQHRLLFSDYLAGQLFTFAIFFIQLIASIYIIVLFIFYLPLIAVENKGILGSIERSIYLVFGNFWRTLKLQMTPWLCYLIALIAIRFGLNIHIHLFFLTPTLPNIGTTLLHLLIFAVFLPWIAAVLLVQLHDLELRKKSVLIQ